VTRLEVQIGDVVLRGFPASYAVGFGGLVERRIRALAAGEEPADATRDATEESALADRVAERVWDEVRQSGALGGGRP
jgi:hypothetical protein